MISASTFARQTDLWRRLTPASESFIRSVNRETASYGIGLLPLSDPRRRALISEIAFNRVSGSPIPEAAARRVVSSLPRGEHAKAPLMDSEENEIELLRNQLDDYLRTEHHGRPVTFRPLFRGCGVVDPARGDIVVGSEIIEVKTVDRAFRSVDFRQILTYSALAYQGGQGFSRITLLNPLRGSYYSSSVENVVNGLGAASWPDLMLDIADAMARLLPSG